MSPRRVRLLFLTTIVVLSGSVSAQAPRTELEQLRRPKTVPALWRAIESEIVLGKLDTAAAYIKELLALEPSDKDLVALEEQFGIGAFLDLNRVPRWSTNDAVDQEAKKNVQNLINRVTAAVRTLRSDPERIQRFIRNLTATPEERDYALIELRKSGSSAMPFLIGSLVNAEIAERRAIQRALAFLDQETIPALLASFDIPNPVTRVELLDALAARDDLIQLSSRSTTDPRPTLWKLSAGDDLAASKAKNLLSALTEIPLAHLPPPSAELAKIAEDIYQHRSTFAKEGPQLQIWMWKDNRLTSRQATPSDTEEYFGLRYARWAIELDPKNDAAWTTYYSLAAEKAQARGGVGQPLAKTSPDVHQMISLAPPRLLYRMLDRALAENHPLVALAALQVIGERGEVRDAGRFEGLLKALHSQDRRLQLEAADTLIRLPSPIGSQQSNRVVEVYRRALAGENGASTASRRPRVLIAEPDELRAKLLSEVAEEAGWSAIVVPTGRDGLRRLAAASDIDSIWVSAQIVYPTLPDVLAQARADYRYGKLPLVVYVPLDVTRGRLPEIRELLDRLDEDSRGWLIDRTNLSAAARATRDADGSPKDAPSLQRLLEIDRSRYPIRVELRYDALKLSGNRQQVLQEWLDELSRRHPIIRQITSRRQRILISITKTDEGLNRRLDALAADLAEAKVQRISDSVFVIELPSADLPNRLSERLARLLRDYASEIIDDYTTRRLNVEREIATTIVLTLDDKPVTGPTRNGNSLRPDQPGVATTVSFDAEFERDKLRRTLSPTQESRLESLVTKYRNTLLVAEPLTTSEFLAATKSFDQSAGLMAMPLSEAEVKDCRRRAMDAFHQMALGAIPGYDIRPASDEIVQAINSDDLASLAIETASRLPAKEVQFALARVVLDSQRPVEVRRSAARHLVRQIQHLGVTSLSSQQIVALVRQLDDETDAEVKAGIGSILGALPDDRILSSLEDSQSQQAWMLRALNYRPPSAEPMAAPMKEPERENP